MEAIAVSLSEMMESFNKRMNQFEADLSKTSSNNPTSTSNLSADFLLFRNFTQHALNNLQQQVELLARTVDVMEMRGRRKFLLVHGVVEKPEESTVQVITELIKQQLKVTDFLSSDVKRCHRMGKPTNNVKSRPILVKFHQTSVRDKLWFSKTSLKGTGITVSEFLTKTRHDVFMAAREKFGISRCWTKEGFIYVLGDDNIRHRVLTMSELNHIHQGSNTQATAAAKLVMKRAKRPATIKK